MDIKFNDKNGKKSSKTQSLICSILDVLESVGVSFDNTSNRMKEQMALCCLALSGIHEKLNNVSKISPLTTKQIISKWNEEYEDNMSLGSYDSVRDGAIKKLMGNGLIIKEQAESTNSSTAGYYLYPRFVELLTVYESEEYSILLEEIKEELKNNSKPINLPKDKSEYLLQQIFYGAPGTGKSHTVEQVCKQYKHHRTTFHPDSDYSTFVGCYKPTMLERKNCMCNENIDDEELGNILLKYKNEIKPTYNAFGKFGYDFYEPLVKNKTDIKKLVKNVLNKQIDNFSDDVYIKIGMELYKNKSIVNDKFISYSFVPQTFIQSYTEAWQYPNESVFLVIEEINRGNCAQIFGDIFQLLDRNDKGWSSYAIDADKDLQGYLCDYFAENGISENAPEDIKSGKKLLLPPNLHIWATMNTSDQSLFPIDSAFKRRWDWKYVPIDEEKENWAIDVNGTLYSWSSFLRIINDKIYTKTNSEDKQLGFYFCKAKDGIISADKLVSKVLFYIYKDIYKDYGFDDSFFNDDDNTKLSFRKYYDRTGNVNEVKVEKFLMNLGVEVVKDVDGGDDEEEEEDGNTSSSSGRDYTKYSVNSKGNYGKNRLALACVQEYVRLHPDETSDQVLNTWNSLGYIVSHFIESKEEFDARTDNTKDRSEAVRCGDGNVVYVRHDGYGSNGKADVLIEKVHEHPEWGIKINIL